jgi:ankyrin repeat protein
VGNWHQEIVEKLLYAKTKANVNAQDSNGFTLLHLVIGSDHSKGVGLYRSEMLSLERHNAQSIAAWRPNCVTRVELVKLLLRSGVKVNARGKHGITPLHLAAEILDLELLRELGVPNLSEGNGRERPNPRARDSKGWTPLHWAVHFAAKEDLVDMKMDSVSDEVDVDLADNDGITPLQLAFCVTWKMWRTT